MSVVEVSAVANRASIRTLILLASLLGGGCKEVTETVVGKGVQVAKDATKGVSEGIEKGRKEGESTDGAVIVSKAEELTGKGSIAVRALRTHAENPKQAEVELALENAGERPLRFTGLQAIGLDRESFVNRPVSSSSEVTVPPRAKERLVIVFDVEASKLAKLRVWGVDHDLPAVSASAR